jgi:hypothetical protein
MIYECEAAGDMRIGRGNRSIRRKSVRIPLCPPQIPHDLASYRNECGDRTYICVGHKKDKFEKGLFKLLIFSQLSILSQEFISKLAHSRIPQR